MLVFTLGMCFLEATKRVLGYNREPVSRPLSTLERCKFREWETSQGNKSANSIWENGGRLLNWIFLSVRLYLMMTGRFNYARAPPRIHIPFFPRLGNESEWELHSFWCRVCGWHEQKVTADMFIVHWTGPHFRRAQFWNCVWSVVIVPFVSSKKFLFRAARLKNAIEKNGFGKKLSPLELIMGFQAPHSSGEIGFNCRVGLGGNFWASFDTSADRRENARRRSYAVFWPEGSLTQ